MSHVTSTTVGVLQAVIQEAQAQGTPGLLLALFVVSVLLRLVAQHDDLHSRLRAASLLVGLQVLLLPVTGLLRSLGSDIARDLRFVAVMSGTLASVGLGGLLLFGVIASLVRLRVPRILQDLLVAGIGTVAVFGAASRAGVNLSGIVATGAVLTAVIGLALQDTLGNLMGGLSVQFDSTIRVGDWIRVAEMTGRVVEMGWRSTSIETRNWETVVLPNSLLTRSQVTVLGRRQGQEPRLRRTVYFNVDFRATPTQVIETVLSALRSNAIENVATDPPPDCILIDLGDSSARFAVRYFLLDIARDDSTDSVVRTRIYFALNRAGIPLAMPAQAVFVTEDSTDRKLHKQEVDLEHRTKALSRIGLFGKLEDFERTELVNSLKHAPFARGEVLTRQGADAHHLYLIVEGRVSVRAEDAGSEREVAQLGAGEFFGEMSLLTGEKRSATVVALSDVDCYRLDAEAFKRLLQRRPDLADQVAAALAERRVGLIAKREELADRKKLIAQSHHDLLYKIREFFEIQASTRPGPKEKP